MLGVVVVYCVTIVHSVTTLHSMAVTEWCMIPLSRTVLQLCIMYWIHQVIGIGQIGQLKELLLVFKLNFSLILFMTSCWY